MFVRNDERPQHLI